MPERIYDGYSELIGVDSASDPLYLPSVAVSRAVNRTFRGKINKTRPPIRELRLTFDPDVDQEVFYTGNLQGIHPYLTTSSFTRPGLVASIAGNLYFIEIAGSAGYVRTLFTGNDPLLTHVWFAQGQEQLYVQNGFNDPVAWNGQFTADGEPDVRVITGAIQGEPVMPIGTVMCYAHGRIVLANADNQIIVSDHFNGAGAGIRTNMDNFTENTTFLGGFFSPPAEIGRIGGIIAMPSLDNYYGQAEVIIPCERGFAALDISTPRNTWTDARLIFRGAGCYSPYSLTPVNNDLWYRSSDGIRSLRQARTDEAREWGDTVLSREVSYWTDRDAAHLLRFSNGAYFDNRLIMTTYPEIQKNANGAYGDHRFHNGMVVLDYDRNSTVNPDAGFGWDGLWTGVKPTGFAQLSIDQTDRLFSSAFDGVNRIYEFMPTATEGSDSYYDSNQALAVTDIKSHFITKAFSEFSGRGNIRTVKRLIGGGRSRVRWSGAMAIDISFRPDDYPCWTPLMSRVHGCATCQENCDNGIRRKFYKDFPLETPDPDACQAALNKKVEYGTSFQFLVQLQGDVEIPFMSFAAMVERDREDAECEDTEDWCQQIVCCDQPSFDYDLRNG